MKAIITEFKINPICTRRPGSAVWPVYDTKVEIILGIRSLDIDDFEPIFDAFREKRMVEIQPAEKSTH
jgi:hypothetical protein